jgi:hypothetical protein
LLHFVSCWVGFVVHLEDDDPKEGVPSVSLQFWQPSLLLLLLLLLSGLLKPSTADIASVSPAHRHRGTLT